MMKFLTWVKTTALALVDKVNEKAEPFEAFSRPIARKGAEVILEKLAADYAVGLSKFTSEDGKMFQEVRPTDLGDLCIWQGVYSAFCSLTAHAPGEDGLAQYVSQAGVLFRGNVLKGEPWYNVDPNHASHYQDDGARVTRDDASLDSLCGFVFGVAMAHKRNRFTTDLKRAMRRLATRFVADGYRLKNVDGSFTTYGDCRPGVFQAPVRNLMAALVAFWGEKCGADTPGWRKICGAHGKEFERLETHFMAKHAWYNDHLAMLAASAACMADDAAFDPARRGFDVLLQKHTKTGNAFIIAMAGFLGRSVSDEQKGIFQKVLTEFTNTEFPNGKGIGTVKNEDYPSFIWDGQRSSKQPVPAWRRPPADYFWQRNPYTLEGANYREYSGLDFLMAFHLK